MAQINGVVMGIVKDLDDPKNLGRVKVYFPWMSENNQSHWARIATLMAGSERGSWFMPEINDEVLVAFEQGSVQNPYILGGLWNGQMKPPNQGINNKVRRLKTVSGHIVEFDDRLGQEAIRISTPAGNEITIEDLPPGITISTPGGNKITLEDVPPGISISCPTGIFTVNCLQANIIAAAMLSVTAPIAQFSGVVQASAFTAGAYTPAPGNTFGL
jgi:phage baseplate assembly protein gpV